MQFGFVFPTREIDPDPERIVSWVRVAESMGYQHVMTYDHVVGVDDQVNPEWEGRIGIDASFHEPLVMLGFLAGLCSLELVTGVLVLPQRQTALVAKQVAEIDLLSRGHVRLGVGIGWNHYEYRALGVPFERRGIRISEQVGVLRDLWSQRSTTISTSFHDLPGVGICPRPTSSYIPIWMGAQSKAGLRRAGRISDGLVWLDNPSDKTALALAEVAVGVHEAGRDPADVGLDVHLEVGPADSDAVLMERCERWSEIGATHVTVTTSSLGYRHTDEHLVALDRVRHLAALTAPSPEEKYTCAPSE